MAEQAPNLSNLPIEERQIHELATKHVDVYLPKDTTQVFETPGLHTFATGSAKEYPESFDENRHLTTIDTTVEPETAVSTNEIRGITAHTDHQDDKQFSLRKKPTSTRVTASVGRTVQHSSMDGDISISRDMMSTTAVDAKGEIVDQQLDVSGRKSSFDGSKGSGYRKGPKRQIYEVKFTGTPEQAEAKKARYAKLVRSIAARGVKRAMVSDPVKHLEFEDPNLVP